MCVDNHVHKNLQEILSHGGWEQCSAVYTVDLAVKISPNQLA